MVSNWKTFSLRTDRMANCSPKVGELREAVRGMNNKELPARVRGVTKLEGSSPIRTARTQKIFLSPSDSPHNCPLSTIRTTRSVKRSSPSGS